MVFARYVKGICMVCVGCLKGVFMVSVKYLSGVRGVSVGHLLVYLWGIPNSIGSIWLTR